MVSAPYPALVRPLRTTSVLLALAGTAAAQTPEVVRSSGPGAWGATVRLVEEVRVGVLDGDERYTFGSIREVVPGAGGTVWVLENRPVRIRIYDAAGRFVRNVGGDGEGPGEYRQIDGARALSDGSVVILDGRNGRISIFGPGGEFRASHRHPVSFFTGDMFAVDAAGSFYVKVRRDRPVPGEFTLDSQLAWVRIRADGTVADTLPIPTGATPAVQVYGGPYAARVPPLIAAFSPHGYFVTGSPGRYAFDIHRPGQRVLRVEREHRPVPLGRGERAEWQAMAEHMSSEPIGMSMRLVNGRPDTIRGPTVRYTVPANKPAFRTISVDDTGTIWIERYVAAEQRAPAPAPPDSPARPTRTWYEPRTFDLFEPTGRFLGTVVAPRNVNLLRARRGMQLYGIVRGEFDEQYVVRYRMEPAR
jgi:hypothetical protein